METWQKITARPYRADSTINFLQEAGWPGIPKNRRLNYNCNGYDG